MTPFNYPHNSPVMPQHGGGETLPPHRGRGMTALTDKIRATGRSINSVAREIGVSKYDLRKFIARRFHKVGRARRRLIRDFFRSQGWLPTPTPRETHECPTCKKVHVVKRSVPLHHGRQDNKPAVASQSEAVTISVS